MLGFMFNEQEVQEVEYMLRREMEEILLDLSDPRIDDVVKVAMEEKYQVIFNMYKRFVPANETLKYLLKRNRRNMQ
ncbi:hypothetical protein [Halalkalibacter sp. APA_J-10(15)]|uniref:hypothetical protein n=1 Tax=unclassified Halalkalibacter TaxID=2893063 RepID=UPI001FF44398|nr:hypothetical protein [Halalkalibacter sp. APA_J-10(15)]MCK0473407.1 hypothetical protein [Halalkalibacter sp. APA_J-10(15)]